MNLPIKICLAVLTAKLTLVAQAVDVVHPAASSLTRPTSAEKPPNEDGFIQRWLVLEPIRNNTPLTDNAIKEAVKKEYFPNQLELIPRDGEKVKVQDLELTWHAVDT